MPSPPFERPEHGQPLRQSFVYPLAAPPPVHLTPGYAQASPYATYGATYFPPPGGPYANSSDKGTRKKIFAALSVVALFFFVMLRVLFAYLPENPFRDLSSTALRGDPTGEKTLPISYLKSSGVDVSTEAGMQDTLKAFVEADPMYGGEELIKLFFGSGRDAEAYIEAAYYDKKSGDLLLKLKHPFDVPPRDMMAVINNGGVDYFGTQREASAQQRMFLQVRLNTASQLTYGEAFRAKYAEVVPSSWRGYLRPSMDLPAGYLVATPMSNLKVSAPELFTLPFHADIGHGGAVHFDYDFSLNELAMFMSNANAYGGAMRILDEDLANRQINVVANHGAFVTKPDEPSLTRLLHSVTDGYGLSREVKIQILLNIASSCIVYDNQESRAPGEILKRPNETLLSRRGDCSSKTILLASLLEQFHEDYLLVYYKDHINLAVPAGNFRITNGLSFNWEGKSWVVAETTVPGFRIGATQIETEAGAPRGIGNRNIMADIELVQRPSEVGAVYDYHSKKKVRLI